jgi:Tripartite tricarboxylate transporter family receptor
VRPLGVTTLARWSVAPNIPLLNEARVPGFDAAGWFMVAGPAATPKSIVERLYAEFKTIMGLPGAQETVDRTGRSGREPAAARAADLIASEKARWGNVVQQVGWRERSRAPPALSRPDDRTYHFFARGYQPLPFKAGTAWTGCPSPAREDRMPLSSLPGPWVTVWKTSGSNTAISIATNLSRC